jgi:hypothetical protein
VEAQCRYSPIRHLASILWPPWIGRSKALLVMLTFAFDGGGDAGTEYMTVAGFASSVDDWDDFSVKWKSRLDRDGIEFFRTVDANSFRGPFEHWRDLPNKNQLRRALFADLIDLIKSHTYRKFSCTIINGDFQNTNTELREAFAESAYSVAARTCEKLARLWVMREWKSCRGMEIACIFEAGDLGQGKLQDRLRKDYGHIPPSFRPKKDTIVENGDFVHGFVPLQAADWLAWEINRAARDFYPEKLESESQLRWPMQQLLRKPEGYIGIYTLENLRKMDDMIELENKITNWEIAVGLGK